MEDADNAELDDRMHARMLLAEENERRPMTGRLIRLILGASTGLLLGGQLVIAADRIDLFDTKSNRAGYIIVDPKTRRFDTYDTKSRRTGWGTITQDSGTVDAYDRDGNRVGRGRLPGPEWKR
jgi:hypothetical protein